MNALNNIQRVVSWNSKKTNFVVISETNRPEGQRIAVSGKAEARRVANERNAQPWNF